MLNRLILVLSLLGMVLALHLWIQKARGFDQGCLGLEKPAAVTTYGCAADGLETASHLFGVSNAAWGYAFYFGVALLAFGKIVATPAWARRLHGLSELGTLPALGYSWYLVYVQAFVAHAYCVLCLASVGLITLIFALHACVRRRGGFQPIAESDRPRELGYAAAMLFGAVGLIVSVVLFVNRIGTRPLNQGDTEQQVEQLVGDSLPMYIDPDQLFQIRACRFDDAAPRLNLGDFVPAGTPFLGNWNGDAPVIIAFYDPNGPRCRQYNPVYLRIAAHLSEKVRFYILPRLIWDYSIPQVEALHLAAREGKYFEMWQRQFDHQATGERNMSAEEIEKMFRDLGLSTVDLARRLEAERASVVAEAKRANAAGIDGIPYVYVNGAKVAWLNRSEDCVLKLIAQSDRGAKPSGLALAPDAANVIPKQ
jgi:uncharacterized membrane protein